MSAVYEETDYDPHRDDLINRRPYRNYRFESRMPDGRKLHLQVSAKPWFSDDGEFLGYRGAGSDVTDLVVTQADLEAKTLELIQSQKMKAIGQLTGGVAHDFNNLLTVVLGNLELVRMLTGDRDDGVPAYVEAAYDAAQRGSSLIAQLMAFSRKQALKAETIVIVDLIEGMRPLLSRVLGENIVVDVECREPDTACWADPAQLQNAILNLSINARDAMPAGGRLSLKVRSADVADGVDLMPGAYAQIEVSDLGTGMPADVREQAFEPFFTTKEMGEGTGLGLSMVYGFAKQSHGSVQIDSAPGAGCTVTLWLPTAESATDDSVVSGDLSDRAVPKDGHGERILLVEDDDGVRKLLDRQLSRLGYEITVKPDASGALASLSGGGEFDLLLTDIVLAGKTDGVELAARAQELCPELRVIFMTGYTEKHEQIRGRPLLAKPFSIQQLSDIIRASLDS